MLQRSAIRWEFWPWVRRSSAPPPPPVWERRIAALEVALLQVQARADRADAFADAINAQIVTWMDLNTRQAATIEALQLENADLRQRLQILERQLADMPPLRNRTLIAEAVARIWQADAHQMRVLLAQAGVDAPPVPDIPEV